MILGFGIQSSGGGGSGTIGGGGTVRYIPVFTPDGTHIGNSSMYEDVSGNIGLNTTTPLDFFNINTGLLSGGLSVSNGAGNIGAQLQIQADAHGQLVLYNNLGAVKGVIKTDGNPSYIINGNVGIGTATPDYILTVINGSRFQNTNNANALVVNSIGGVSINTTSTLSDFTVKNNIGLEYINGGGSFLQFHRNASPAAWSGILYNDEGAGNNSFYLWNSASYIGLWDLTNIQFGFGTITPNATGHFKGMPSSNINQRLEPVANVTQDTSGATISTIDATPTTLQTLAIPNNSVQTIVTTITYRKTGGAGIGTTGQGTTITLSSSVQNIAGVLTLDVIQNTYSGITNAIAGASAKLIVSGTNIIVQVTGVVSDNITWNSITTVNTVS